MRIFNPQPLCLWFILCLLVSTSVVAQKIVHPVETEVFVLKTSQPEDGSLFRVVRVGDTLRKMYLRKLQIKSRHLSAFRIEEINPLRYYYFINNQLVTQFMDATPTVFGKSVTNQGNSLTPTSINFLRLFNLSGGAATSVSDTLLTLEKEINSLKDSILIYQTHYSEVVSKYDAVLDRLDTVDSRTKHPPTKDLRDSSALQDSIRQYANRCALKVSQVQSKIEDYVNLVNQKVSYIQSNNIVGVFSTYGGAAKIKDTADQDLSSIEKRIGEFPDAFDKIILVRNEATGILDDLLNNQIYNPPVTTYSNFLIRGVVRTYQYHPRKSQIDSLTQALGSFGVTYDISKLLRSESSEVNSVNRTANAVSTITDRVAEAFRIKKAIAAYVFNFCEQFILRTTLDVGELLQAQVFELSRFKNEIQNQSYINDSTLLEVRRHTMETKDIFEFIQKISTDLTVYANVIQANSKSYQGYLNSIDSNYVAILDYLKVFDFINRNNSVEYTLPASSNVANADFIRYSVSRLDKNTLSSEDLNYDIWLKGGIKIDFSAGFFASGLVDNQYQKLFITHDPVSNTDSIQVHRVNDGGYSFGFGGMVNLALRTGGSWVSPGISLGFIYSNNQKLQIVSGAALHLGKTERIIVHVGIAAGTVKTFDDSQLQYASNTITKGSNWGFRVPSYSDYTIPALIDRFTVRPCFGISYNLSKSSPFNAASEQGQTKYNSLLLNSTSTGSSPGTVTPK